MNDPTELHEAASTGSRRLLESLLVQGHYDVDSEDWTYEKKTPLHVAIERGNLSCVRTLLCYGADPAARTRSGLTPAHFAAESGDLKCLKALVGYDAAVDLEDNSGITPLRTAQIYGHQAFSDYLSSILALLEHANGVEAETREVEVTAIEKRFKVADG